MKTLFLARHAKSDWNQPGYSDFDRPLNATGEMDAPIMVQHLQKNYSLDYLISSDAARAIATATVYKNILTPTQEVILEHSLYNALYMDIADVVSNISEQYCSVMLVGHNPGMTELVDFYIKENFNDMPSCGVAIVQFNVTSWKDVHKNTGVLLGFEYPKKVS